MLCVRCAYCSKLVGFEEKDAGMHVACPFCRQPFFVPLLAQPVATTPPLEPLTPPLPPPPELPEELHLAPEPTLAPPEPPPADPWARGPPPKATLPLPPEPPPCEPAVPAMELEPAPPRAPETLPPSEAITTLPAEWQDLPTPAELPMIGKAAPEAEQPCDVLEEVKDNRDYDVVPEKKGNEEEEHRSRRRHAARSKERRTPPRDHQLPQGWMTVRRLAGIIGVACGGLTMFGLGLTYLINRQTSAGLLCCGSIFGVVLLLAGVYYLINEG